MVKMICASSNQASAWGWKVNSQRWHLTDWAQFTLTHKNKTIQNWNLKNKTTAWCDESEFQRHSDAGVRTWSKLHESIDPSCFCTSGSGWWGCGDIFSAHFCVPYDLEHRLTPPPTCWVSNLLKYFLKYILCKLTWWCQLWLGRADRSEVAVRHWGAACWGPDTTGTDSEHTASYKLTDMFPIREGGGADRVSGWRSRYQRNSFVPQLSSSHLCARAFQQHAWVLFTYRSNP